MAFLIGVLFYLLEYQIIIIVPIPIRPFLSFVLGNLIPSLTIIVSWQLYVSWLIRAYLHKQFSKRWKMHLIDFLFYPIYLTYLALAIAFYLFPTKLSQSKTLVDQRVLDQEMNLSYAEAVLYAAGTLSSFYTLLWMWSYLDRSRMTSVHRKTMKIVFLLMCGCFVCLLIQFIGSILGVFNLLPITLALYDSFTSCLANEHFWFV